MNWKEYKDRADETLSPVSDRHLQHALLGIQTEVIEYVEYFLDGNKKGQKEEMGDFFWYVALICNRCSKKLTQLIEPDIILLAFDKKLNTCEVKDVLQSVGAISDQMKRIEFYGNDPDYGILATEVVRLMGFICMTNTFDLPKILDANIKKLDGKRYKKGFTKEEANNRDVDHELSHIDDE